MKKILISIIFMSIVLGAGYGFSQVSSRERAIEQEKRNVLGRTESTVIKGHQPLVFDYGGWFNYRYDDYDNYDNDSSVADTFDHTSTLDLRLWLKVVLKPPPEADYENEHSLYIRLKNEYAYKQARDIAEGWDHDGTHVDYAYVILDLRPLWIETGRRYFNVGHGIAYSNVGDGVELTLATPQHVLTGFFSRNLENEENIDLSVPGYAEGSERYFFGSEYTFRGITGHGIYGYVVVQRDESEEKPADIMQDYKYDSEYLGLGARGEIVPSLKYWAEVIRETGQTRVFISNDKKNISAWSWIFGTSYDWDVYSHPKFSFQYAFGSGDPDRISVTDTNGGNIFGKDKNFLYFGYLETGYALSPLLSNLHIYSAGISFKPLEASKPFKDFTFALDYYKYYKDKPSGGIFDLDASGRSHDVGSEIDIEASWQVMSDVGCTVQYGYFIPAGAYPPPTDDSEDYFSVSTTIRF